MKKISKRKWIGWMLTGIGALPFAIVLVCAVYEAITGMSFLMGPVVYGFRAFMDFIILASYLYWPAYLIGVLCIGVGIWCLRKKNT